MIAIVLVLHEIKKHRPRDIELRTTVKPTVVQDVYGSPEMILQWKQDTVAQEI